ncbi:MAG: aspartate dehydrogenase domain-containing protein [Candidatus Omnitrophota bacterium]
MRKKILKIGIVGCGAIGSSLARIIVRDLKARAELTALFDININKLKLLAGKVSRSKNLETQNLAQLIGRCQLVIEAASAKSSWEIARKTITEGRDIMVMSVGGIAPYFSKLHKLAGKHGTMIYIPSGAIAGIDALKAARVGRLRKVILRTIKNPASFKGVEYVKRKRLRLDGLKKDKILFSGSAASAIKYFPQNINVAAVLGLVGLGLDKTKVEIIASSRIKNNVHKIRIESNAGTVETCTENVVHPDNPKTSYLAVLSALAMLRQILEPVKIGT